MSKKKYLYESVSNVNPEFRGFSINYSFPDIKIFASIKENLYLYKTLVAVLLSGASLAAIFLFNWIFVFVLIPSAFLAIANFADDYKMLKIKEDFEENGIFWFFPLFFLFF